MQKCPGNVSWASCEGSSWGSSEGGCGLTCCQLGGGRRSGGLEVADGGGGGGGAGWLVTCGGGERVLLAAPFDPHIIADDHDTTKSVRMRAF